MDDREHLDADRVDVYGNHLYLAEFGRHWAKRVRSEAMSEVAVGEAEYLKGYAQAIDDIAGHLEAGEGLPCGPLYVRAALMFVEGQHETA